MDENEISKHIVDSAFRLHMRLGPGLFEHVYEEILAYELVKRGLPVKQQEPIPLIYDDLRIELAFKADLLVNNLVIVELKSVVKLADIHKKQVLTYLKISNLRLGLLINFNETLIKDGIVRIANGMPRPTRGAM